MTDVVGVALVVIAALLLLDKAIPRASAIAAGLWLLAAGALMLRHGVFPGIAFAIAALTAPLSIAVLAAPVAPRALRIARGMAIVVALAAAVTALAGVAHG